MNSKSDLLVSNFAFACNLYRYISGAWERWYEIIEEKREAELAAADGQQSAESASERQRKAVARVLGRILNRAISAAFDTWCSAVEAARAAAAEEAEEEARRGCAHVDTVENPVDAYSLKAPGFGFNP